MAELKRFIDIHSHIIFGADDGAQSLMEAVRMLKLDRDEGAFAVFATPHYGRENNNYTPDAAMVMRNFELLKERAAEEVPEVRVYLGTEWFCSYDLADRVRRRDAFRMNGTDYVLTEFREWCGMHEDADVITENLTRLRESGYRPVLAHAERFRALQDDWDLARRIREGGTLLQVNAYDLYLNSGARTRNLAQWLAKERLASFVGSDMHGTRAGARKPRMKEGIDWLYEHTDEAYADAVAFGNAEELFGLKEE